MALSRLLQCFSGIGTTVNAVTADLITVPIADNVSVTVVGRVTGRSTLGTGWAGAQRNVTVRRQGGGAATLVGAVTSVSTHSVVITGVVMTFVVSGNNLILRVTGVAATTIDWTATVDGIVN